MAIEKEINNENMHIEQLLSLPIGSPFVHWIQ